MKKVLSIFLYILGIILALLGLAFLIASHSSSTRIMVGILFLILSSGCFFSGIKFFSSTQENSSTFIRKKILKMAERKSGKITLTDFNIFNFDKEKIKQILRQLQLENICFEKRINNKKELKYIFPSFQGEIIMKQCPNCGNDYPVNQDIEFCSSCGGDLKLYKTNVSDLDQKFSL